MVRYVLSVALVTALSGCFIESATDRMPTPSDAAPVNDDLCQQRFSKGCVVGHIPVINLFVKGEKFHDADNLYQRFAELVVVRDQEGLALAPETYEFSLNDEFGTSDFARGFEVYLTGDDYRKVQVGPSGQFVWDDVSEGTYDVRVQKPLHFSVTRDAVVPADASEQGSEPVDVSDEGDIAEETVEAEPETKAYCASLYAETKVAVRRGEMVRLEFKDFQLHIYDKECKESRTPEHVTW